MDFFYDSDVGSNGTLLSAHSANFGGGYSNVNGGDPFLDGTGRIKANGAAAGITMVSTTPPNADYALQVDVTHLDVQTDQNWHLQIRTSPDGTTRYSIIYDATLHGLSIAKFVSGAFTSLGSAAFTPTAGQTYRFILSASGTTITATKDGTNIVAPITDSSISAAGVPGIVIQGANTVSTGMRMATVRSFPTGSPSAALSCATPTLSSQTSTTANVVSTGGVGGITPYTYQWYRSTTNGFTPGGGSILAGQTGLALNDTGLTPSTTYYYILAVTDAASITANSTQLAVTQPAATPTFNSATVPAGGDRVNIVFSASVATVLVTDFLVTADGIPKVIGSVTGSGATRVLVLPNDLIAISQVVKVSYIGGSATTGELTATNSSTLVAKAPQYVTRSFGIFVTWSSSTFTAPGFVTQATMNSVFNPTGYNADQWLDAVVASGARYVVLTAKHDGGFCLWPTASGAPNIAPTPWYASTRTDIILDYTTKCRARGLGVGLYINFYDPWYTTGRPGHDGTYGPPSTYTAFISQQITELLSNYGKIDMLWTDSWGYTVGYTNAPYATINNLVKSLQPNCVVVNNDHTGDLTHSDIAVFEGDGVQAEPVGNLLPAEFCETNRADIQWAWQASGQNSYKDPFVLAARLKRLEAEHAAYLLNYAPNNLGLLPASNVTFANTLGAIVGLQGGTLLPIPANVRSGIDRGDGVIGTYSAGGGGSGVTCAFSATGCHMIERFQG